MTTPPPAPLDPTLERALKAIGACLAAAEAHVPKTLPPQPPGRSRWLDEIPKWGPLLTPIIVAVLGALLAYYLTGYFQQTLDLRSSSLRYRSWRWSSARPTSAASGRCAS
jgi:hypothetical protein